MEWNKKRVRGFLENEHGILEVTTTIKFVVPTVKGGYQKLIPDTAFQRTLITNNMLKCCVDKYDLFKWQFQEIGHQFYKIFKELE